MEFHEKLQSLAVKEGLKGRKVTRALESFSWNITILKVRNMHTGTHTLKRRPLQHVLPAAIGISKFALRTCGLHLVFSYSVSWFWFIHRELCKSNTSKLVNRQLTSSWRVQHFLFSYRSRVNSIKND